MQQAMEASEIFGWLGEKGMQVHCSLVLALLLRKDEQLDAAEEAASRVIDLSEKRDQHQLCQSYHILGVIHRSKGNGEKALHHFEASLRITSSLNLRYRLSEAHLCLASCIPKETSKTTHAPTLNVPSRARGTTSSS